MKSKRILSIVLFLTLIGFQFSVERIELDKPIEFQNFLEKNNVFLKMCLSFDVADGYFYFLDTKFGTIFKVDENTGKLVKTISSKGQSPSELQFATKIRVRNKKIFVLDGGFNGFKIFDIDGKFINAIKLTIVIGQAGFDVNEKDEIFLGRYDRNAKMFISVYNLKGLKLRTLTPFNNKKEMNPLNPYWYYYIRLDKTGKIYLLFYQARKLSKYDGKGNLIWERPVNNEILERFPNRDNIGYKNGTIRRNRAVFCLDITANDNVIIGHKGGACLFSADGKLKSVISDKENFNFGEIKVLKERLVNLLLFGEFVKIYRFKEE